MTMPRPQGDFIREDMPTPAATPVTEKQGDKDAKKKKADEAKSDPPKKLNEG